MKLKENFITHMTDGEQVLISTDSTFCGLARSNETAAFIIDCLKEDTTEEKILDKMCESFDAPREKMREGVRYVIGELVKIGALDE